MNSSSSYSNITKKEGQLLPKQVHLVQKQKERTKEIPNNINTNINNFNSNNNNNNNSNNNNHALISSPNLSYSPIYQSIAVPHQQILDDQKNLREKFKIRNSISLNTSITQSQTQEKEGEEEEDLDFTPTYHSTSSHHLPLRSSLTPPHPFYNSNSNQNSHTNSNSSLNSIINPNLNQTRNWTNQEQHTMNLDPLGMNNKINFKSNEKKHYPYKKPDDNHPNVIEFQNLESPQAVYNNIKKFNPESTSIDDNHNSSVISTWMTSDLGDDDIEDTGIVPENRFPEGTPKCFGLTIKESTELSPFYYDGLQVPIIMYRCLTYLDSEEAYKKVGIFRLNALKTEINRLEDIFNLKGDFDLLKANPKPNVHAVTTLFKRWLRENEKVLSVEECEQFLKLAQLKSDKIKTKEFNSILKSMPDENYGILRCIIKYLDVVLKYKELNKNSEESLAMLFSAALTEDKSGKNIPVLREFLKNRNHYFV